MSNKLACLVVGCKRTHNGGAAGEWICGKHWPLVPKTTRAELFAVVRMYRRKFGNNGFWTYPAGSDERIKAAELDRRWRKAWQACKTEAQERAVGV